MNNFGSKPTAITYAHERRALSFLVNIRPNTNNTSVIPYPINILHETR